VAAGLDWNLSLLPDRKEEVLRMDLIESPSLLLLVSFWAWVDLGLSWER
jgi:hypothetical protein